LSELTVTKVRPNLPPIRSTIPPAIPTSPNLKAAPQQLSIPPLLSNNAPHFLVGVLESGDRSSALFTENGLTQRIQLGERIGSSNWILKGVENQKAILFSQGKTRYLEVGQSF
jgi:hypothetical protein